MKRIDLNSDLGEGFGIYNLAEDEEIMKYATSVNIACGFHGGDPLTMNKSVKMAIKSGVAIGAHPGLPDLMGFGRREMQITPEEAYIYVVYQVGALKAFVESNSATLVHVKPHGALYNMAARDSQIALAVAEAVKAIGRDLILVGLAGSELIKAAKKLGVRFAREGFADRAYMPDGSLASRKMNGAIISDIHEISERALKMVKNGEVTAIDGSVLKIEVDTLCVHSDTPNASEIVRKMKEYLVFNGIKVESLEKI